MTFYSSLVWSQLMKTWNGISKLSLEKDFINEPSSNKYVRTTL